MARSDNLHSMQNSLRLINRWGLRPSKIDCGEFAVSCGELSGLSAIINILLSITYTATAERWRVVAIFFVGHAKIRPYVSEILPPEWQYNVKINIFRFQSVVDSNFLVNSVAPTHLHLRKFMKEGLEWKNIRKHQNLRVTENSLENWCLRMILFLADRGTFQTILSLIT